MVGGDIFFMKYQETSYVKKKRYWNIRQSQADILDSCIPEAAP